MAIAFTKDQKRVIEERNKNILVSAAAGSGKTAVLTARILSRLMDQEQPVDIDRMLIVTFTNSAAAEMRERISRAINKELRKNPEDAHLQKQAVYIHRALITTIDSFCKYLIANHFEDIGIDPGLRIADQGELELLKKDTLDEVLELAFEKSEPDFLNLVESYASGRSEAALEGYIRRLYEFSMSYPWPKEWLLSCKKDYEYANLEEFLQADFMKEAMKYAAVILQEAAELLKQAEEICEESDGPYQYAELILQEKETFERLSLIRNYEELEVEIKKVVFKMLPRKKDETVNEDKKEQVKELRSQVKSMLLKLKEELFFVPLQQAFEDILACKENVSALIEITLAFIDLYQEKKQDKNIMDFSDMEHFALEILLEKKEGAYVPTETAMQYQQYFAEIMTDEYQDSNLVQELILQSIARTTEGQANRFMVGDVKQSIYKFRLARPEIFLEKYTQFNEGEKDCAAIDLHQNFRSRPEVIDTVNYMFKRVMDKSLGQITYDDKAALYAGADYGDWCAENETELLIFEKKQETEAGELVSSLGRFKGEAAMIAARIKRLMRTFQVKDEDTGGLRPLKYGDIAILLRSGAVIEDVIREELTAQGIPVYSASRTGYFSAIEVRHVLDYLKVINNPYKDHALCGVLKSPFFACSDDQMAIMKGMFGREKQSMPMYQCIKEWAVLEPDDERLEEFKELGPLIGETIKKADVIWKQIESNRKLAKILSVHELMETLFVQADYVEYITAMSGGVQKRANVEMLLEKAVEFEKTSFHGLFYFVRYIEQLEKYQIEYGEANLASEQSDCVKIMTIHKSKGLEFPVCIVAGLDKRFNMQDTYSPVIMDVDWGIGTEMIDPHKRVKAKTIRKNIIAAKWKLDNLGEELRILYVAMTRAKEKLILCAETGKIKSLYNDIDKKGEQLSYYTRTSASSPLHYVVRALCSQPKFLENLVIVHEDDLQGEEVLQQLTSNAKKDFLTKHWKSEPMDEQLKNSLLEKFAFIYPHDNLRNLYTKTSVSELKLAAFQEEGEEIASIFETERPPVPYLPAYMREQQEATGTGRGNAYHKVLEMIDYKKYKGMVSAAEVFKLIDADIGQFVLEGKFEEENVRLVDKGKIANFISSFYGQLMCEAAAGQKLYKEKPFVIALPANRIDKQYPKEEALLIQGIIDVYFEINGELIVLDYKTDRVNSIDELVKRYKTQLDYYKEALEQLTGKKAAKRVIYSFALEEDAAW